VAADAWAGATARSLRQEQARALSGRDYDPDALDAAILANRRAQAAVATAWQAWLAWALHETARSAAPPEQR
jgi:hypothetical protein